MQRGIIENLNQKLEELEGIIANSNSNTNYSNNSSNPSQEQGIQEEQSKHSSDKSKHESSEWSHLSRFAVVERPYSLQFIGVPKTEPEPIPYTPTRF